MIVKKIEVMYGIFFENSRRNRVFPTGLLPARGTYRAGFHRKSRENRGILGKTGLERLYVPHCDAFFVVKHGQGKIIKKPYCMGEIRTCSLLCIDNRFRAIRTKSQTRMTVS